jgi:SecD/SecF fusion protein
VTALLLFGGDTLKDFAFALLVGVASGAYSSIFIASPVLTHWKERERVYVQRDERIRTEHGGLVPAYAVATVAGEEVGVEAAKPVRTGRRRRGRVTAPDQPEEVSREEFDDMVADIAEETGDGTPDGEPEPEPAPQPVPARGNGPRARRRSSTSSTAGGGATPRKKPEPKPKGASKSKRRGRHGRNR